VTYATATARRPPAQHLSSYVLLLLTADAVTTFAEMQAEESGRRQRRWNGLDGAIEVKSRAT
jgi:hypothetical protein